jgi:WD40 repeat protein
MAMRKCVLVLAAVVLGQWAVASAQEVSIKQTKVVKNALAVSADFVFVAETVKTGTGLYDYALIIKECESDKKVKTLEWDKEWGDLDAASFSLDGKQLAILCGKKGEVKTARVFDLSSGEMRFNLRHPQLKFVAFSPDSKQLASAGGFGASSPKESLWIWDSETRKKRVTESPTTPTCIAFSPDGKLIVAAHGKYDTTPLMTTCQVATGERARTFKREGKEDVVAVAFSPNSKFIAAGNRDGIIKLYDAAKGNEVASFDEIQDEIFSVAFHPTRNVLAAAGKDKTIRFWDLESKKLVSTTKLPELDYYLQLQFSTDGTKLATYVPRGNIIKFWNVEVKK